MNQLQGSDHVVCLPIIQKCISCNFYEDGVNAPPHKLCQSHISLFSHSQDHLRSKSHGQHLAVVISILDFLFLIEKTQSNNAVHRNHNIFVGDSMNLDGISVKGEDNGVRVLKKGQGQLWRMACTYSIFMDMNVDILPFL